MPVICANCKAENHDRAMFCCGCAGKLQAFVPTGRSALDGMWPDHRSRVRPKSPQLVDDNERQALLLDTPTFWIGAGAFALVVAITFSAWYTYVTRRPTMLSSSSTSASAFVETRGVRTAAEAGRGTGPPKATPVLPQEDLEPRASAEPAMGDEAAPSLERIFPSPTPMTGRRQQPQPPSTRRTTVAAAANPREMCVGLNFIAAARCEATQCDKAKYQRSPRCDAVREERRRDEARRNHTFGY